MARGGTRSSMSQPCQKKRRRWLGPCHSGLGAAWTIARSGASCKAGKCGTEWNGSLTIILGIVTTRGQQFKWSSTWAWYICLSPLLELSRVRILGASFTFHNGPRVVTQSTKGDSKSAGGQQESAGGNSTAAQCRGCAGPSQEPQRVHRVADVAAKVHLDPELATLDANKAWMGYQACHPSGEHVI